MLAIMMRVLVAVALLLVSSTEAGTQTTAQTAGSITRNQLNDALARLQLSVQALGPDRPARLAEAVEWLRRRAATTDPTLVSTRYLQTLTNAATLLSGVPSRNLVDDITEELEAKVDHCQALDIGMAG